MKQSIGIEIKPLEKAKAQTYKQPRLAKLDVIPRIPFRISIIGASHSGKSVLVSSLLTSPDLYTDSFKKGNIIVFSPTSFSMDGVALDSTYEQCGIPIQNIYHPENAGVVLDRLFEIKRAEKKKKNKVIPSLVIFDDCVHDKALLRKTKQIEQVFVAGRHFGISCIFVSQYFFGTPKSIRQQATFVCIFRNSGRRDFETFYELYNPSNIDSKTFQLTIEAELAREDYSFISVNMRVVPSKRFRLKFNDPPISFQSNTNKQPSRGHLKRRYIDRSNTEYKPFNNHGTTASSETTTGIPTAPEGGPEANGE